MAGGGARRARRSACGVPGGAPGQCAPQSAAAPGRWQHFPSDADLCVEQCARVGRQAREAQQQNQPGAPRWPGRSVATCPNLHVPTCLRPRRLTAAPPADHHPASSMRQPAWNATGYIPATRCSVPWRWMRTLRAPGRHGQRRCGEPAGAALGLMVSPSPLHTQRLFLGWLGRWGLLASTCSNITRS